jgi:hypothetical protein
MGPWGIAAIALVVAGGTQKGREIMKRALKEVVKVGYEIADMSSNVVAEAKEEFSDLVEEVKAEQGEPNGHKPKDKKGSAKHPKAAD